MLRADSLPAEEALRFLFRLDNELYRLQGQKAVEYGGGVHTKHRHTRYHDFFVGRVQPGERVLDIGSGIGVVAHHIAEKAGARVVAIDINSSNIEQARRRYPHPGVEYRVGDALKETLKGPFDVIILSNVLHHLADRTAFLRALQAKVRPSRFLIREVVFERDWRVPLKRELGVQWREDPTHATEYTLQSFAKELREAGLRITHQETRWGEIWAEAVPTHNG
jgi:ubiquinone/menaquinone biosynthesis C-methylase UbiE